jgi:hypothetical protein
VRTVFSVFVLYDAEYKLVWSNLEWHISLGGAVFPIVEAEGIYPPLDT